MSTAARLREYDLLIRSLIREAQRLEARDLVRIRGLFSSFVRQVRARLPGAYTLNDAVVTAVLTDLAREIDRLQHDLGVVIRGGLSAKEELAREMVRVYGAVWEPELAGLGFAWAGASPEVMRTAADYTARLVGWSAGGLAARIQGEVDSALRLGMLGLQPQSTVQAALSRFLGFGNGWSYSAERIYRTEVNRFHSLLTEANVDRLARTDRTLRKRWNWSGIAREEHARIHGQTVRADGYFRVPRKPTSRDRRTMVEIAYPRAVVDRRGRHVPGDVTVCCGCYHVPLPAAAAALPILELPRLRPIAMTRRRAAR